MILPDTSALIESFRRNGRTDIKARVKAALLSDTAVLCDPVLLELYAGARGQPEIQLIQRLEKALRKIECDQPTWLLAQELAKGYRQKGLTFSNSDLLIFATAIRHDADILAVDSAFTKMKKHYPL